MNIKELTQFIQEYDLKLTQKLIKYLVIIGISTMKTKTQDISIETIKLIASSCRHKKLKEGMAELKERVMNIQQSLTPKVGNFNFLNENKFLMPSNNQNYTEFSPIQKRTQNSGNKLKKALSIQESEINTRSLNLQRKERNIQNDQFQQQQKFEIQYQSQPKNNFQTQRNVNLNQIANNFLSSPLIKNPLTQRNQNNQQSELQYFFQNTWKQF